MRTGLLSDLAIVGYEIFLVGDHVKLHYLKQDTPPDTARPLIDELRKHKAEVVNILMTGYTITSIEKKQSLEKVKATWSPELQSLVDWFLTLEPREIRPFYLEPHRHIDDPVKFFATLRREIAAGPAGPRSRTGAIQCDLRDLRAKLN